MGLLVLGICFMFKSFPSCGIGFSVQVLVSDLRKLEVCGGINKTFVSELEAAKAALKGQDTALHKVQRPAKRPR